MHIDLPERISTKEFSRDLAVVIDALSKNGITSVEEVRITLRTFNEDDRECFPADDAGDHTTGFRVTRPAQVGPNDLREMTWTFGEPKPKRQPPALGPLRGLQSLLGPLPK